MAGEMISVQISNCNNIASCTLNICPQALNIKYAINGTGKSTIAKAIKLYSEGKPLKPLMPFSLIAHNEKTIQPSVSGISFTNVVVFDDDYVKQYVYQKSDLLKNTFEVMINTPRYIELKESIDARLSDVKMIARDKPNIEKIKNILQSLCQLLVINNNGTTLSRKTSGVKSLLDEGKGALFNPPKELEPFRAFLDDEKSSDWASWKFKGITSFGAQGICPFCAEKDTETKKLQTKVFQDAFDEVSITYANKLREYLSSITEYIDERKMNALLDLLNTNADKRVLEMQLVKLRTEAHYLFERLYALSSFDGYSIDQTNMNEFESKFADMAINEVNLDFFNTELFFKEIRPLNEQITQLLSMIGALKGEVAIFQKYLHDQVKQRKEDINDFMQLAGFSYSFDLIISGENNAHAILKYCMDDGAEYDVSNPDHHLSWGERNAFALLLFMFDAISKNADLIILDDPISSFDSNKKYAIINRLFKTGDKQHSLYQKTVLMLTHDLEPVIDYIQVGGKLSNDSVYAYYLQNESGNITEKEIKKNHDILSMVVLMKEMANDYALVMPVRIGCLRKYIEHTTRNPREESMAYNVLSSAIHGRPSPTYDSAGQNTMSTEDRQLGIDTILEDIPDFDYDRTVAELNDLKLLNMYENETNDFCKLLILRAYIERNDTARARLKVHDDVLRKYVDETYHVENDYLYCLDVRKFNIVPLHYRKAAKRFIADEFKELNTNSLL